MREILYYYMAGTYYYNYYDSVWRVLLPLNVRRNLAHAL